MCIFRKKKNVSIANEKQALEEIRNNLASVVDKKSVTKTELIMSIDSAIERLDNLSNK